MLQKFVAFLLILGLAGVLAIVGSESKTIVCSNQTKTCVAYSENSLLKSKNQTNTVDVSSGRGRSNLVFGVGVDSQEYLFCEKNVREVNTKNGKKIQTKYYLVPSGLYHDKYLYLEKKALNIYSSQSICDIDRLALNRYLKSNDMEDFAYKVPTTTLGFLWYLGSALFVLLAFLVLFKAKVVTGAEAQAMENEIFTDEQKQEMSEKAQDIMGALSKLDGDVANKLSDLNGKFGNIKIDFNNDNK